MGQDKNAKRVRLNLLITPAVRDQIEALQQRTAAESMTEVIRRALAVYDELQTVVEDGGRLIVENRDGELEILRLV